MGSAAAALTSAQSFPGPQGTPASAENVPKTELGAGGLDCDSRLDPPWQRCW